MIFVGEQVLYTIDRLRRGKLLWYDVEKGKLVDFHSRRHSSEAIELALDALSSAS